MDAGQVEQQLLNEVRAARGHDVFTGNSALDLVEFIKTGAREMADSDQTSEEDLGRAKENLLRFLDAMEAGKAELGYSEYREDVVEWAREKLCPIWPFCE